jgi:chromate transporter
MDAPLLALALRLIALSLFAVGGGVSILIPQMHSEFVNELHWLDDRRFAEVVAVAQAAPGPNFLLVPLLGFRMDGLAGALVGIAAFLLLPVTISFAVGRMLRHETETIVLLRRAFRAVTAGLWIATGIAIAHTVDHTLLYSAITAAVTVLALGVETSPLWWCLGAGIIGAIFG